jgi:hypothetical protein
MEQNVEQTFDCCPPFDPAPWDDRMIDWHDKKFVQDRVMTFLFMPLNFGGTMRRLDRKIREAGATVPDNLGLSDHVSRWKMNIMVAVDKEVPGAQNIALSGSFYSRVYEGPFQDTGKWMKDADAQAGAKGLTIKKWYMWYTTCPKCAKKYGKNYVAVIGEVS